MYKIVKGSKEHMVIDVDDELGELTTLETAGLQYSVKDRMGDDTSPPMNNLAGDAEDMQARCLIDTTGLDVGQYRLFIKFNALPEVPVLGPFLFQVSDD